MYYGCIIIYFNIKEFDEKIINKLIKVNTKKYIELEIII